MTLLFMDGFDDALTSSKWSSANHNSLSTGRNGNAAYLGDNTRYLRKQVAAADEHATFIVGAAVYITGIVPSFFLEFTSDSFATVHGRLYFNANKSLTLLTGNGLGVSNTTAIDVIQFNTWHYLELKMTLHDTTGSYTLKIDGVSKLTGSGIDTKNAGTKTVYDGVRWWGTNTAGATTVIVDDFYLCNGAGSVNNDFLGDVTVETLYPSGNGNYSQLLGSDADSTNNYLLVDEAGTPNTADYVGSATVGQTDTYTFSDLAHATGTVKGLQLSSYVAKSDSGSKTMSQVVRSGGTDSVQTAVSLQTSYNVITNIFDQNPIGPAAWTIANVNSAEFGVQIAS